MDDTENQLLPDQPFSPMGRYDVELFNAIMGPRWTQTPQPDRDVTPLLQPPSPYPPAYPGGTGRYLAPPDTDLSHPPYTPPLAPDGSGGIHGAQADNIGTRPSFSWIPQPLGLPDARPDLLHKTGASDMTSDLIHSSPVSIVHPDGEVEPVTRLPGVESHKNGSVLAKVRRSDGTIDWLPDSKLQRVAAKYPDSMPNVSPPSATPRPGLLERDPNFVPVQPQGNLLIPFVPTATNIPDWLTGPPGVPQATADPAYQRRYEGTLPLPGVRPAVHIPIGAQ